jgi:hypothetical protein
MLVTVCVCVCVCVCARAREFLVVLQNDFFKAPRALVDNTLPLQLRENIAKVKTMEND